MYNGGGYTAGEQPVGGPACTLYAPNHVLATEVGQRSAVGQALRPAACAPRCGVHCIKPLVERPFLPAQVSTSKSCADARSTLDHVAWMCPLLPGSTETANNVLGASPTLTPPGKSVRLWRAMVESKMLASPNQGACTYAPAATATFAHSTRRSSWFGIIPECSKLLLFLKKNLARVAWIT